MDTNVMHRGRRGSKSGLKKAKCVRSCRAKHGKGRWARKHKRTLTACRRGCGVKKK